MDRIAIVYHKDVEQYDFGQGHPFRGERFPRFIRLLMDQGLLNDQRVQVVEPEIARNTDLHLVHSDSYIRLVHKLAANYAPLSGDTPMTPSVAEAAKLIVGSALKAGELVIEKGFSVAEGVGGGLHHAGRDYGGGFCVFNDVAVCAQALIERYGLERVLVFDSDAHAGNGTMDIFYEEPRVLFISVHQDPRTIYPGTGFIHQIGRGRGEGYTVNIPLPRRADDACMKIVLERVLKPLLKAFEPQIIIRNGGSDPHFDDGLATLGLTYKGLRSIGEAVADAALTSNCGVVDLCCSGYNPKTVVEGWFSILSGVIGLEVGFKERYNPWPKNSQLLKETNLIIDALIKKLSKYWKL